MAIVTSGRYVGFVGTLDGITYYPLKDGRTVAKQKNTKSDIPLTQAQLSVLMDTAVFAQFMKPLTGFVQVGYDYQAQILNVNPYNAMVRCLRKNVMQGKYPNRSIDFSKVLVTKGTLPAAETSVAVTEAGLAFSWDTAIIPNTTHHSDQVIMLAYFPDLGEARYVTAGNSRHKGNDLLALAGIKKGYQAEVYISFITDDHRNISNSVYLGQFNW